MALEQKRWYGYILKRARGTRRMSPSRSHLAIAIWIVAEDNSWPAGTAASKKVLLASRASSLLDPRSLRNVLNLDLCLPDEVQTQCSAAQLEAKIIPVTLLVAGEGAAYQHKFHSSTHAQTHTPAAQPGISMQQGSRLEPALGVGDGYCAWCDACAEAQRQDAAAADEVFGHLLSFNQRYIASRFAAPRLHALVSVASLSFGEVEGAGVDRVTKDSCQGFGRHEEGCTRVKYSMVIVTQDACNATLRHVLQQAEILNSQQSLQHSASVHNISNNSEHSLQSHEHLHLLLEALAAKVCARPQDAQDSLHTHTRGGDLDRSPLLPPLAASGEAEEDSHSPLLMFRRLLDSQSIAQKLDDLMHALSRY